MSNDQPRYDLEVEAALLREQLKGTPNPVDEARNLLSQTILAEVLLALSDVGFYEYVRRFPRFQRQQVVEHLKLDAFVFRATADYLVGRGIFLETGEGLSLSPYGERTFNVYTRGVLNIYLGAYKEILHTLPALLGGTLALSDPKVARSTRHAAAGTAYATCGFTIPAVFSVIRDLKAKCCLDLGCGTGDFLIQYVRQDQEARGVGVDLSAEALRQARERSAVFEVDDRLTFHEAAVGTNPLPVPDDVLGRVEVVTSMYMLHEFGRNGRDAIVQVLAALRAQLPGRLCVILEVEACDPAEIAKQVPPPPHYGRLDYRLIHELSLQGLPRAKEDWHGIFESAGCQLVEPGVKTGGSLIYAVRF